eukprot:1073-Hanusia_phi.AAC.1
MTRSVMIRVPARGSAPRIDRSDSRQSLSLAGHRAGPSRGGCRTQRPVPESPSPRGPARRGRARGPRGGAVTHSLASVKLAQPAAHSDSSEFLSSMMAPRSS